MKPRMRTSAERPLATGPQRPAWAIVLIGLLLGLHAGLAFDTARQATVTHDEYWHVPTGLLNLRTGRFDFDVLNPPLIRVWAAIPLLFGADPALDREPGEMEGWGDLFLEANREDYQFWILAARVMIIVLSVATGGLTAAWAWRWFGPGAGCLAALLWSCCPSVLAHGSIVTTDLGAAFFFVLVLYLTARHAERPTWSGALWLGVALGLAQLAKFTCVLLYPLAPLVWLVLRRGAPRPGLTRTGKADEGGRGGERDQGMRSRSFIPVSPSSPYPPSLKEGTEGKRLGNRAALLQPLTVLVVSLLVLNAGYLFRGSFATLESYSFGSRVLKHVAKAPSWLREFPLPLPRDYLTGLDGQQRVMEGEHPVYLDGEWRTGGFPLYYAKTLLYKLPHATQALILLTVVWLILSRREPVGGGKQFALLIPAAVLLAISSLASQQLGVRYVLPAFPLLFVFAAQTTRWFSWRRYPPRTLVLAVLIAAVPLALRHHPHHLAYFNELAGGPVGGRAHLLDSNLDWGQDLHRLKAYLDEHPVRDLRLAYFGTMSPEVLGIEYRLPPSRFPEPGWHAVSVNFVQGRPHLLRDGRGGAFPAGMDEFGYFRFFEPVARAGYSIDVYHLTELDVAEYGAALRDLMRDARP